MACSRDVQLYGVLGSQNLMEDKRVKLRFSSIILFFLKI